MDEFNTERQFWLALSVCNGIGPIRFQKLLQYFDSAKNAWNASLEDLKKSGIGEKMSINLRDFRYEFSLKEYEEKLQK